jgi:DNA-binding XRE family transcriptional regulator
VLAPSCDAHDLITRAGKNRYDCERYIEAARYVVHVQLAVYVTTISKSKSAPHLPPNLGGTAKQESLKPSPSGSSPSPKRVREPIPTTWGRRLRALKNESDMTWGKIAQDSGVARRQLLAIANEGVTPSNGTRTAIRDYIAKQLKRRIRF